MARHGKELAGPQLTKSWASVASALARQRREFAGRQCRYVTPGALAEGYHACGRYAGHKGPHVTVYELTWDWVTREEYAARYGAAKRRRRPSSKKTKKAKR